MTKSIRVWIQSNTVRWDAMQGTLYTEGSQDVRGLGGSVLTSMKDSPDGTRSGKPAGKSLGCMMLGTVAGRKVADARRSNLTGNEYHAL